MFCQIQHQPVGAGHLVDQADERAGFGLPFPDPARGVLQPGLALIGEIERPVAPEMQIVAALKAFGVRIPQRLGHGPRGGIQQHDAVLVIRQKDPPVAVDLQPVGLAVVFRDLGYLTRRIRAEHPSERNVDEPQVPIGIERRLSQPL